MNFFKIKTSWSNAELGVLKVCVASIYLMIGVFFHNFLSNYYVPLIIIFGITVIWTFYLWVTKMKNRH